MDEWQNGWADKWLEARQEEGRLGRIPMGGDGKAASWWKAFKLLSSSAWGLELYKSKMSRRHWSCLALFNETQTQRRSRTLSPPEPTLCPCLPPTLSSHTNTSKQRISGSCQSLVCDYVLRFLIVISYRCCFFLFFFVKARFLTPLTKRIFSWIFKSLRTPSTATVSCHGPATWRFFFVQIIKDKENSVILGLTSPNLENVSCRIEVCLRKSSLPWLHALWVTDDV